MEDTILAKYKIGVTEAGDAGLDLSWINKLHLVDGAIVITKCVSPDFHNAVHATITGYGGTKLEPNVPLPVDNYKAIMDLIDAGFLKERIVVRVDPIIPTSKGILTASKIIGTFMDSDFSRYRISVIDMYPHVRKRFEQANLTLPYNNMFSPNKEQLDHVDRMIRNVKAYWLNHHSECTVRIETCAEPELTEPIIRWL